MELSDAGIEINLIILPRELVRNVEYSLPLKVNAEQQLQQIYSSKNKIKKSHDGKSYRIKIGSANETIQEKQDDVYTMLRQEIYAFQYPEDVKLSAEKYSSNIKTCRSLIDSIKAKEGIDDDREPESNSKIAESLVKELRPNHNNLHGSVYFSETPTGLVVLYSDLRDLVIHKNDSTNMPCEGFVQKTTTRDGKQIFVSHCFAKNVHNNTIVVSSRTYEHEERHIINAFVDQIWENNSRGENTYTGLKKKAKDEIIAYAAIDEIDTAESLLLNKNVFYNYQNILDSSKLDDLLDRFIRRPYLEMRSKRFAQRLDRGLLSYLSQKRKNRLIYKSIVRDAVNAYQDLFTFYKSKIKNADEDYIRRFTLGVFDAFDLQDFPQVAKLFKHYSAHNDPQK